MRWVIDTTCPAHVCSAHLASMPSRCASPTTATPLPSTFRSRPTMCWSRSSMRALASPGCASRKNFDIRVAVLRAQAERQCLQLPHSVDSCRSHLCSNSTSLSFEFAAQFMTETCASMHPLPSIVAAACSKPMLSTWERCQHSGAGSKPCLRDLSDSTPDSRPPSPSCSACASSGSGLFISSPRMSCVAPAGQFWPVRRSQHRLLSTAPVAQRPWQTQDWRRLCSRPIAGLA